MTPARRPLAATCIAIVAAAGLALLGWQVVLRCGQPLGNSDVFWQVRAGQLALATGHVPDTDPFSYTIHGDTWNNHEWAFEIGAALLQRAFGWGALRLLVVACWAGTALAVGVALAREAGLGPALLVLNLLHVLAAYKMKPVPQAVSMPLLFGALYLFRGARMLSSRTRAALLVPYMLLWGNLTAEALTILPFLAADQLCLRRGRRPEDPPPDRTAALLLVLGALAPFVNPPWSSVLDYALRGTAVNRVVNAEFTPIWRAARAVQPLAKIAGAAVIVIYLPWAAATLARSKDRWATLTTVGGGLVAVAAAVLLERDLWLLVLPAAQMLIALSRRAPIATAAASTAAGLGLYALYAGAIGWDGGAALASLRDGRYFAPHVNEEIVPVRCVERIAPAAGKRLYTLRLWASYAIWRLPEVRVFYDGRNLEYGPELFEAGAEVWAGGPRARAILDATKTDVVIARAGWEQLRGLQGGPWRPVFVDRSCAVFERAPTEAR